MKKMITNRIYLKLLYFIKSRINPYLKLIYFLKLIIKLESN